MSLWIISSPSEEHTLPVVLSAFCELRKLWELITKKNMSKYKTKNQRIRINSSQFQVCSLGIPCALLTLKKSTLGDIMCGVRGGWGSGFF
jgi:hypothetical protein